MTIAVVALSARAIVQAARRDGLRCIAIDAFGDADTRLVAPWRAGGEGGLDDATWLAALRTARDTHGATAWVAGSGFEGRAAALAQGEALLPLLGTAAADRARIDDLRNWFAVLDEAGIAHPPVRLDAPPRPEGWLHKRPGAGGMQVVPAALAPTTPDGCWLAERSGAEPWSATFVADGRRARVWGLNRQWADPTPERPYRFGGIAGPFADAALHAEVTHILNRVVPRLQLRGLCSIDLLRHGGRTEVLEVNARPPASLALYPGALRAHVQACAGQLLPPPVPNRVLGVAVVYTRRRIDIDRFAVQRLAASPRIHDRPMPQTHVAAGLPLCSLSAIGASYDTVRRALERRRTDLLNHLETPHERSPRRPGRLPAEREPERRAAGGAPGG